MKFPLRTALAIAAFMAAMPGESYAQNIRFQGMDRNGDGVITRDEWRGSNASFNNEDWNGDGVLSGDELRPGARKPASTRSSDERISDRNAQGGPRYFFTNLDRNHDGWITRNEWNMGDTEFNRLDVNRDNRVSQYEFQSYANANKPTQPSSRFSEMDTNRDGLITWNEWRGTEGDYVRLDVNGDARLNPSEFDANPSAMNRFSALDANRDGWLTRDEWKWSDGSFYRMDRNSDNRLSRMEFQSGLANTTNRVDANEGRYANAPAALRSRAAQSGYDRGMTEGRQAGREDYTNGHGWDLEGQTELERADSGYSSQVGGLGDYQSGYREGFRIGYREGFAQR
jgi:Ca2+-binding EF-hand superfamily protein